MRDGYKPVFDAAKEKAQAVDYLTTFEDFHNNSDLFHFAVAPYDQYGTDDNSLVEAKNLHEIGKLMILKGPSRVGGGSDVLDGVESRHILMMANLANLIGTYWGRVVEIGGGYGNWARLADGLIDYNFWAIVDMPYMLNLQQWFLDRTQIDTSKMLFVPDISTKPDIVIGAHSLSEFSQDDFMHYYYNVIKNSRWFYYVSHGSKPDKELLDWKYNRIRENFSLYSEKWYEAGSSVMYLFENKNA